MTVTSLAVVTPAYNDAAFLPSCMESVREAARQVPFPVEHAVVDDGSTDATPALLFWRHGVLTERFRENRGPSAALNHAVSLTTAPWLLVLAADDVVYPHTFADFADAVGRYPDANVIYSDLQNFGTRSDRYTLPPFDAAVMQRRNILPGCSFIRRDLFDAVGGFDEGMRSAQDWDFWVRADLAAGLRPVKLARPVVGYRWHDTPRLHNESARHIEAIRAHIRSLCTAGAA